MKLYELTGKYAEIQQLIEDGEDPEVLADTLDALEEAIGDKVDAIHKLIRNIQADIDALKAEEKRLAERRKVLESQQERLKAYVERELSSAGIDKVKTSIGIFGFRKAPPSIEILDISQIPAEYLIPQEPKVDKKGLLNHFKETGEAIGFRVIDDKRTLQFR
jgi:hypothetical protein